MKKIVTKLPIFLFLFLITQNFALSQLNGTYTIGLGGSYSSISSAVNALESQGVSGPVTFNIKTGTYNEAVTIDSIRGTSLENRITFQSETGNRDDVLLSSPSVVVLNRADFISFISISISNFSGSCFKITSNSDGISLINNKITCGSSNTGIYGRYALTRNLKIENNYIDSYEGITLGWDTMHKSVGTIISNNLIKGLYGISLFYHDSLYIEKNQIEVSSFIAGPPYYEPYEAEGILLWNCGQYCSIIKNNIIALGIYDNAMSSGVDILYCGFQNSRIENNFVYSYGGSPMRIKSSSNINIYFNTFKNGRNITGWFGYPSSMQLEACTSCSVKNNIFAGIINAIDGNLLYSSDHNCYYGNLVSGAEFEFYYNGGFVTFEEYRTASNNDINSVLRNVNFIGDTDLHLSGFSVGDTNLIGIPITGITDDIDGNMRDPLYPYMGADEPISSVLTLTINFEAYNGTDTISADIRSAIAPYNLIETVTGFGGEGLPKTFHFSNAIDGTSYYLVVKHRNSIETWSASSVTVSDDTTYYDFTTSVNQAYGNNMIYSGGIASIYSGDVNQDGFCNISDLIEVYNAAINFASGYLNTDLTGDRIVDNSDLVIAYNNANNFVNVIKP